MKSLRITPALAAGLFLSQAVLADPAPIPSTSPTPPAPACQVLRTAKAKVYVSKLSVTQQNGTWNFNNQLICTTTADVSVVQQAQGCSYSQILTCDTILDGANHTVTVSGLVYFYNTPQTIPNQTPLKIFGVSYYIDRNNGESGFSAATSENLSLGSEGVITDTSRDRTPSGTAYNDSLNINVTFDDANAQ